MRIFLLGLFSLFFCGCQDPIPKNPPKFQLREKVRIAVNGRPAYITDFYAAHNMYTIRYADEFGELKSAYVGDFEIEKWSEEKY